MEAVRFALEWVHGFQVDHQPYLCGYALGLHLPAVLRLERSLQRQVELPLGWWQCLPHLQHCLRLHLDLAERVRRLGNALLHVALPPDPPDQSSLWNVIQHALLDIGG